MKKILLFIIRLYQKTEGIRKSVSMTLIGVENNCRFLPTCSEYTYQAIEKYGIFKGLIKGFNRIKKCHPGNPGGIDPLT